MELYSMLNNLHQLTGWSSVDEFAVGGLMYIGFSKTQTNQLLCISSQYMSLIDCNTGGKIKCEGDFDEENFTALCSYLPDELIDIYGAYGGQPILDTQKGERISIIRQEEFYEKYGKEIIIKVKVIFNMQCREIEIFNDYGFYTCSFSVCGNYFALAHDGGIAILKRNL